MRTARRLLLAALVIVTAIWMLLKEPDSSELRAELAARSQNEGLALACFYSIPGRLTIFDRDQPVYVRTNRFGFAGIAPDGKHFFVNGSSLGDSLADHFSGLEDLTGKPNLAVPSESVRKAYRYAIAPDLQHVALCRFGEMVRSLELSARTSREVRIIDEKLRRADYLSWSPTGSQLAFEFGRNIYVYDLADGLSHRCV